MGALAQAPLVGLLNQVQKHRHIVRAVESVPGPVPRHVSPGTIERDRVLGVFLRFRHFDGSRPYSDFEPSGSVRIRREADRWSRLGWLGGPVWGLLRFLMS